MQKPAPLIIPKQPAQPPVRPAPGVVIAPYRLFVPPTAADPFRAMQQLNGLLNLGSGQRFRRRQQPVWTGQVRNTQGRTPARFTRTPAVLRPMISTQLQPAYSFITQPHLQTAQQLRRRVTGLFLCKQIHHALLRLAKTFHLQLHSHHRLRQRQLFQP